MNIPIAASTHRFALRVAVALLTLAAVVGHGAAEGADVFVTSLADKVSDHGGCSLKEAIYSANTDSNLIPLTGVSFFMTGCVSGSGDDTIILPVGQVILLSRIVDDPGNPFGPTATPMITSRITVEMNGTRLQWVGTTTARAFAVASTGDLTIRNAYILNFVAKGGNGGSGGGGGLGAGGAIYVKGSGSLTVDSCTFEGNGAVGGNGGTTNGAGGGGGGGMGGNGGAGGGVGTDGGGGGGGGGSRGKGAASFEGEGGGGGGTLTDGVMSVGGTNCGAAGGGNDTMFIGDANGQDVVNCPGGGGGGGVAEIGGLFSTSGNGGHGGYGGGGGGGGDPISGGSQGGDGDFGGGGGASGGDTANLDGSGHSGGKGGFGAGGGAGHGGLFGGGPGISLALGGLASHYSGGGGAGLGGAIFSDDATVSIVNSTFTTNYAVGGVSGGAPADNGTGAGGAIFSRLGSLTVLYSTISGNGRTGSAGGITVYRFPATGGTFFTLRNSIISNNGPLACGYSVGAIIAGSGNLIQDNLNCPGATDADPMLGPLAYNDGLTPTMAITDSSPAFDAADASVIESRDQRGAARPQGAGFDIGAYESCVFDPKESCFGFHSFEFTRHLDASALPAIGGTVSPPSGDYALNSVQPLIATPNAGFSFVNWTGTVADPTSASTFVVMDQDQVVTANFAGCVINVSARGTVGNTMSPPRVDLTWMPNGAAFANVFRSATSGGPYAFVGSSTTTSFTDTTAGLVNNTKAYYVLQFFASATVKLCDSSEVAVTIPRGR